MTQPDTNDYLNLFLNDVPMMDVRAPIEYDKGAFPHTSNLPLLDDRQRELIGTRYKDAGQDEAIKLGLELMTPSIREQRLGAWSGFTASHPDGYLYCFRGGLRSRTTQAWLKEQGIDYPLIKGGYKAMRSFLIDELQKTVETVPFVILGGLTGSGKTRVLHKIRYQIDLEGLANHKGSAFGRSVDDYQPTPINWENALSIACLKYRHRYPGAGLLLEDEGKLIGRLLVPIGFYRKMLHAPRILLQRSLEERVEITREDYVSLSWPEYQHHYADEAEHRFRDFWFGSLDRIQKRLGGERHSRLRTIVESALNRLFAHGEAQGFDEALRILLDEYYDPMYRYQLESKPVDILFEGDESAIIEWAHENLEQMT
jgi:tRNA 2-selenouridine synthase